MMPKASKPAYYAVRIGRAPGIYLSWAECEAQVRGFNGALYKKLRTEAEANEFMVAKPSASRTSASRDIVPAASAIDPGPKIPSSTVETAHSTNMDEKGFDVVYCDGACKGNGQVGSVAGIGVWWGHGDPRNISERCPGDQTNNRAELIAIVRILETAPRLRRPLLIKTDSKYSIQCVSTWIYNWMRNGFLAADGKPVKNRVLIKYLATLLHVRRKTSQTVEFKHVRGHVGIEGNEAADRLANLGATMPMVPERDWQELEKEVLNLKPAQQVKIADDDLKTYADALLSDDELTELINTSIPCVELPGQAPGRRDLGNKKNGIRNHTVTSLVPPPPPIKAAGLSVATPCDSAPAGPTRGKLTSRGSAGRTSVASLAPRSVSSKKLATTINKEELETLASCLLGDAELSSLGKDGVFDSDF